MAVDIEAMRQRIALVNSETAKVNNTRNMNIGKRQTLEKQCADLFKKYSDTYGVTLTPENLSDEVQRVTLEKEREVQTISGVLNALQNGDYATANKMLGFGVEEEKPVVAETQKVSPIPSESVVENFGTQTGIYTGQTATTEPFMVKTDMQINMEQNAVVIGETGSPVMPVMPVMPVIPQMIASPPVVAAPPVVEVTQPSMPPTMPSAPTLPNSASHLTGLSGTDFMNNVEEKVASPLSALAGFSSPQQHVAMGGLDMPNLDNAPTPPSSAPTTFEAIMGGTQFANK